ncbi:ATP-binding cassette sub- B member 6, mitochondrial [Tieghemiomyces parasiticus]|uniref:ATP-binding cassette sub- B member 6, mitochondrial n=1 Tax=Tieghemiomyces parasiticus TaxID=78921 RepID=A0A9W8AGY0_9FUNG|nr:ATP-binding cassette sub- B member 6, mitochondrial [Tieghemiomyces parasiticus]
MADTMGVATQNPSPQAATKVWHPLVEYAASGLVLALVARGTPVAIGYRQLSYLEGLLPILALIHVILWRRRRGHHMIALKKPEKKDTGSKDKAKEDAKIRKEYQVLWVTLAHKSLWFIYVALLLESIAINVSFLLDSETSTTWRPWMRLGVQYQTGLAVTWAAHYLQLRAAEIATTVTTRSSLWAPWSQAWSLAIIFHGLEVYSTLRARHATGGDAELANHWLLGILAPVKLGVAVAAPLVYVTVMRSVRVGYFSPEPAAEAKAAPTDEATDKVQDVPTGVEQGKAEVAAEKQTVEANSNPAEAGTTGETTDSTKHATSGTESSKADATAGPQAAKSATKEEEEKKPVVYSAFTLFRRVILLVYELAFPIDRSLAVRLAVRWLFGIVSRWIESFEPLYYKAFLVSLNTPARAFPALVRYAVVNAFTQVEQVTIQSRHMAVHNSLTYFTARARIYMYNVIQSKSMRFHTASHRVSPARRGDLAVAALDQFLQIILFRLGADLFGIVIGVYQYSWVFNAYFMPLSLAYGLVSILRRNIYGPMRTKLRFVTRNTDDTVGKCMDDLNQIETIREFASEAFHSQKYRHALRSKTRQGEYGTRALRILDQGLSIVTRILFCIGVIMCLHFMRQGTMRPTDVIFYMSHFIMTYRPLKFLVELNFELQTLYIRCHDLLELIDEPVEVKDPADAAPWQITRGAIEFQNVSFGYDTKLILKDVTFSVPAGTTTAIVGKTGEGKSTLFDLLARFYDVAEGSITIDGMDVRHVKQADLRRDMAIVPQTHTRMVTSILFNIQYGTAAYGLTATREEAEEAAKRARIHDRIMQMPQGYDTKLDYGLVNLSGGEWQRLTIARGLVRKGKIVMLDEATSALDIITEREVQRELADCTRGTTCLIIAHRLPTIIHADQILVLSDGQIVERGNHAELMAIPGGVFKKMWQDQLKEKEKEIADGVI